MVERLGMPPLSVMRWRSMEEDTQAFVGVPRLDGHLSTDWRLLALCADDSG